jgi:hypothetical protein
MLRIFVFVCVNFFSFKITLSSKNFFLLSFSFVCLKIFSCSKFEELYFFQQVFKKSAKKSVFLKK